MNKEWVLAMKAEQEKAIEKSVSELKSLISELPCYTDDVKEKLYGIVDGWRGNYRASAHDLLLEMITSAKPHMDIFGFAHDHDIYSMCNFISNPGNLDRYLDSEPVEFDGDIIITDPCYIVKRGDKDTNEDDWDRCDYGYSMGELGISHYMARNTMYGDWGCTLFNSDTEKPIGEFCADAGMVAVFLLDEVLKYNRNLITISTVRGRQLSSKTSKEPFSSSLPKRSENTKRTLNGIRRETNGEITKSRL